MVQESDINFRTLAYEVNVGIYVCNPKGTFLYANLALADIFGFESPVDMIGRNFENFFSPDKAPAFMLEFRKSMAPSPNTPVITTEIIRNDAKIALIEVRPTPFIKNNELLGNHGVVLDITQRKQAENHMMYTSTHDSLTGIYNRTFFEAEIKRLGRGRQFPVSIVVVIVGGLKRVGESTAQAAGVKIIKRVAHRLFRTLRGDDIVARIGEDQFAILFPNVDENTVVEIIKRIQGDLQKINKDDNECQVEFFIGVSTATNGEYLNAALKKAEAIATIKKERANPIR